MVNYKIINPLVANSILHAKLMGEHTVGTYLETVCRKRLNSTNSNQSFSP